ncbi:MAG TPA: glycosyltransferase [Acidimicrobiales bacterium]|jgi:glycosyltransferase involved in cell wall biosynthesis|nr:glycosyltransferase [Acidimicrobiales bacterium]
MSEGVPGPGEAGYDVVIPTIGRASLTVLLHALGREAADEHRSVFVVDDRAEATTPIPVPEGMTVLRSGGGGPARARNVGWRAGFAPWVVFLDDDVVPAEGWVEALTRDLAGVGQDTAGVQGRIVVPRAPGRRATDWERNVAGLERARWATADMAYRRGTLEEEGGFDERFPRAFREDADLALRVVDRGHRLLTGTRVTFHPVRDADRWVSVRLQRGNADDAMMRALHGRSWRTRADAQDGGRLALHLFTTVCLAAGLVGGRSARVAAVARWCWLVLFLEFAFRRLRPGPWTWREVITMGTTSLVIPPLAVYHRVVAEGRLQRRPERWTMARHGSDGSAPAVSVPTR